MKNLLIIALICIFLSCIASKSNSKVNFKSLSEVNAEDQSKTDYTILVSGTVKRIYPQGPYIFFKVTGDMSTYSFLKTDLESYTASYNLLYKAAENNWTVYVRRTSNPAKNYGSNLYVEYIYVDF